VPLGSKLVRPGRTRPPAAGEQPAAGDQLTGWRDAALSDDTGVPLYVQIRNLLRERIRLGEWAADEPMPTEEEFVGHFGVSRTTVRQAMGDLVRDGLVVRKAGRGTFARQPLMVLRMQQMHSLGADIAQRGLRSSRATLQLEKLDAGAELAHRAAELAEGDVVHLKQVRFADDVPIVVFDHYFPYELCSFLLELPLDDSDLSIERVLGERGIELRRATGEISAALATKLEAKHLKVKPGTPLVRIAAKTYNSDDRVVEYSSGVFVTDRYPLAIYSDWTVAPVGIAPAAEGK
jgi:GntR family transcriptional regulator